MKKLALFPLILATACASSSQDTASSGPRTAEPQKIGISLAEAKEIVSKFESAQSKASGANPLHNPQSLDDVLAILQSDQLDLFESGIKFAATQEGEQAKALHAQLELSRGEAEYILSRVLWIISRDVRERADKLEKTKAEGKIGEADEAKLKVLRDDARNFSRTAEALDKIAAEHTAVGAKLASQIIEEAPNNHLGYRVAADYYRMREDWQGFDKMVEKIKAEKPDSTGLQFLLGADAATRAKDEGKAAEFFTKALEKDPKFTRAQAHLVYIQPDILKLHAEFVKLKALNPHHQLVIWAGPTIERAYERAMGDKNAEQTTDPAIDRTQGKTSDVEG